MKYSFFVVGFAMLYFYDNIGNAIIDS